MAIPQLVLTLLGAPRIERDGALLDMPLRKAMALLAYLAVTGAPHTRDTLAALFWPEADGERARGALRYTLGQLKATLGDGWLDTTRSQIGLRMQPNLQVDVAQVITLADRILAHGHTLTEPCGACIPLLQKLVDLYGGPLLAGFSLSDSPDFDDWLVFESERLQHLQADALVALVGVYRQTGQPATAIPYAQRLLALDPLQEEANQLLISLYMQSNQQAAAIRHYEMFAKRLQEAFNAEPAEATAALVRDLATATHENQRPPREPSSTRLGHALPVLGTPLLGRAHELNVIGALLDDPTCRLLTLLGPGGSGKTSLALTLAHARLHLYRHGVTFLPLAGLTTPDALLDSIAHAVGSSRETSGDVQQRLLDELSERQQLLILDNLEHLLDRTPNSSDDVVTLIDAILASAPGVQIVVTSRVRTQMYQEHLYPVQGLDYPEWDDLPNAGTYGAVQLFVQRARQVDPRFILTPVTAPNVFKIIRLLAGQPLAIELAAAWVGTLMLDEIATELTEGIDLLTSEARNIPLRHRSMRASYTFSWNRLQPAEQATQQALSVFRGGFTREAAAHVAGATPRILQTLIDQSLLQRVPGSTGTARYSVHELLRQFAAEHLAHDPEREAQAHERHAAYYLALAEPAAFSAQEQSDSAQMALIETEYDNIRAAFHSMLDRHDAEASIRMGNALQGFWHSRGYVSEGRNWLRAALALPAATTTIARAKACHAAGGFAIIQGDWAEASALLEQDLVISRALGDTNHITELVCLRGWLALTTGAFAEATRLLEESVALYRTAGDQHGIALGLGYLGQAAYEQRAFGQAIPLLNEALAISHALGDHIGVAWTLNKQGLVALYQDDIAEAERLFEASLAIFRAFQHKGGLAWGSGSLGWVHLSRKAYAHAAACFTESFAYYVEVDDKRNTAFGLERLASLAAAQEEALRAVRLFGAAARLRQTSAVPLPPADVAYYERYMAVIHTQLDAPCVATEWAEGEAMSIKDLMRFVFQHDHARQHDLVETQLDV